MDPFQLGPLEVTTRPLQPEDRAWLLALYSSIREQELASVPWPEEIKRQFLTQQFTAQDSSYRSNYPGAEFMMLLVNGEAAGRLYLHRRTDELRIMDIAFLPPFRGRGLGTAVLKAVQAEGSRHGLAVTIHVEVFNPAKRLYERLGFKPVGQNEVYILMEWKPDTPLSPGD